MRVVVAGLPTKYPCKGNQFIMQVLARSGYPQEMLLWLNHVWVALQLLFMLDILTASCNKINPEILSQHPNKEAWSDMRWLNEKPSDSDFQLWRNAMNSICPSRRGTGNVRWFIAPTHRMWRWMWNVNESTLHHHQNLHHVSYYIDNLLNRLEMFNYGNISNFFTLRSYFINLEWLSSTYYIQVSH